jgi:hypothetical protein
LVFEKMGELFASKKEKRDLLWYILEVLEKQRDTRRRSYGL